MSRSSESESETEDASSPDQFVTNQPLPKAAQVYSPTIVRTPTSPFDQDNPSPVSIATDVPENFCPRVYPVGRLSAEDVATLNLPRPAPRRLAQPVPKGLVDSQSLRPLPKGLVGGAGKASHPKASQPHPKASQPQPKQVPPKYPAKAAEYRRKWCPPPAEIQGGHGNGPDGAPGPDSSGAA